MDFLKTQNAFIITAATLIFIIVGSYYYFKKKYSYWDERGIKGPKPIPLIGNLLFQITYKRPYYDRKWLKEFGEIYGIYWGTRPVLVCADPNLMLQICIKDFDSFTDHQIIDFMNKYAKVFLFGSRGDDWKRLRLLISPIFTKAKMKRMILFMNNCVDDLIQCIKEQNEKLLESNNNNKKKATIDTGDVYNLYALDTISTCCYSLKLKRNGLADLKSVAKNDKFLNDMLKVFDFNPLKFIALLITPNFLVNYFNLQIQADSELEPMIEKISKMLDIRRERINNNNDSTKKKFNDYLQTLVEARIENENMNKSNHNGDEIVSSTSKEPDLEEAEDHHAILNSELSKKAQMELRNEVLSVSTKSDKILMSDIEIASCAIFMIAVGVHTTSVLLSNLTYLLAHHKDIQQKLYQELKLIVQTNKQEANDGGIDNDNNNDNNNNDDKKGTTGSESYTFDYDSLTDCQYLDAIVSEALRLYPPAVQSDRIATQDYYLNSLKLFIPKYSTILLSIYSLQNNPKYWEKPEVFNPDRFMPGNKENIVPGSYCPFGIGPRHCIGMRFSLTETKLAVAKILMNFTIEPAPNTSYSSEIKICAGFLIRIKDPSVIYLPRRKT